MGVLDPCGRNRSRWRALRLTKNIQPTTNYEQQELRDHYNMAEMGSKLLTVVVAMPESGKMHKWVPSIEKALEEVEKFQNATQTKYIQRSKTAFDTDKGLIRWDPDDYFPFKMSRIIKMECEHAKDRNKAYNRKRRSQVNVERNGISKRKHKPYIIANPSKKTGCPALIEILEAIRYPEYKILPETSHYKRKLVSQSLRYNLALGINKVQEEVLCRVTFPSMESHIGHGFGEVLPKHDELDSRLVDKIAELAEARIITFKEIKAALSTCVTNDLFKEIVQPCTKHKRFHPTRKVICDHYIEACIAMGLVKYDLEGTMLLPDMWSTVNKIKDNVFAYHAKNTGTRMAITYYNWGPEAKIQKLSENDNATCNKQEEEEEDVIKKYLRF